MNVSTPKPLLNILENFRRQHGVPAVGAAVLLEDGALSIGVVGKRQRPVSQKVSKDDLWHIGSCGKAMTAAVVETASSGRPVPLLERWLHRGWCSH